MTCWRNPRRRRAASASVPVALAALALATAPVHAAGTAYAVDTAEVGEAGSCKVEAWGSKARNGDALVTANPSCIFDVGAPVELSAQLARARENAEWGTSVTPKAKLKLLPTAIGRFGFSAAGGATYDNSTGEITDVFAYVPATLRLSEVVRINVNAGWSWDRIESRHLATWGIGVDWRMTKTLTLTIESFGELGPSEEAWQTRPRFQTGVRYRPVDRYSVDLIFGRNIEGEGSSWVTLGTTLRFSGE
jgi:hypothetical protein